MTFLLSLSVILSPCLIFAHYKKRSEEIIPVSLLSIIFILYIFGIVGNLTYGKDFIIVLSAFFIGCGIVLVIKHKSYQETAKHLFTPAFCFFLIAVIFIWIYYSSRMLLQWDEFSFWGHWVRSAVLTGKLDPPFAGHPPAIILFEYFISSFSTTFKESDLYRAYILLMISLFLPFMKNIRVNIFLLPKLLLVISFILVIRVFNNDGFSTIYTDPILTVFFAYCLAEALIYTKRDINSLEFVRFSLGIFALTFVKSTGIYFALIACLVFIAKVLQNSRLLPGLLCKLKSFCVLLIPPLAYISWKVAVRLTFKQNVFSGELGIIKSIPSIVASSADPGNYRYEIASNYIHYLFYFGISSLKLSYLSWFAVLAPIFYIFALFSLDFSKDNFYKKTILQKFNEYWPQHLIFIGGIGYGLFFLYLYLTVFSPYEAKILASYGRYLPTYVGGMLICLVMIIMTNLSINCMPNTPPPF